MSKNFQKTRLPLFLRFRPLLSVLSLIFVLGMGLIADIPTINAQGENPGRTEVVQIEGKWYMISYDGFGKESSRREISEAEAAAFKGMEGKGIVGVVGSYVYDALLRAFAWLCDLILWLFSWFVALGAFLLDVALEITTILGFTKSQIVRIGWPIVRDVANMFFALILLVIAFATILRIETYGMKQLLWRLIVAALLINFSLVIGGVIIDGSNLLTSFFIKGPGTGYKWGISAALFEGLKATRFYFWNPNASPGNLQKELQNGSDVNSVGFLAVILNTILGSIVMAITAFVLFAAAVLFFYRMIALWILLILAPMAWLGMILPATRGMWNKWWNEFIKWNIFAPVFAFFLYLAVVGAQKNILINNPQITEVFSRSDSVWQTLKNGALNAFFQNISTIANFIALVFFLTIGLVFARSSGIYGASTIINVGKSWGAWTRKQMAQPFRFAATPTTAAIAGGAGRILERIGLSKAGHRLQAKADQLRQAPLERPEHKKYAQLLQAMSNQGLLNEVNTAFGIRGLIAARIAKERGILEKADTETIRKAMMTFNNFKDNKNLRELEETRPDVIDPEQERARFEAAINRAVRSEVYKKWNEEVFESAAGKEIIASIIKEAPAAEFANAFKTWSKKTQNAAIGAMLANFEGQDVTVENLPIRQRFAAVTGRISEAFTDRTGRLDGNRAQEYIRTLKPAQIAEIPEERADDLRLIGSFASLSQIVAIRGELNAAQKSHIRRGTIANPEVARYMNGNPLWNV